MSGDRRWRPSDGLRRGLLLGIGLVAFGALAHRPDVVLIGCPLLLSTSIALGSWARRGPAAPRIQAAPVPAVIESGHGRTVRIDIDCDPADELLAIRLPEPGQAGPGRVHVLPAGRYRLRRPTGLTGWGENVVLRPDHLVASVDSLYYYGPVLGVTASQVTLPPADAPAAGPVPPRPAGLVGAHRSPRPGDGTDFRAIRPFGPGDRLRHVDWRASLRSGFPGTSALQIRERFADADAEVVLAIDTRVDVGTELAAWSSPRASRAAAARGRPGGGSLDTAIRAACALATGYLRQGDRVGLIDLARPQLYLPTGAGIRHLSRLRHQLVRCGRPAGTSRHPVLRAQQIPAGATTVLMISPYLDDDAVKAAALAARHGGPVVALDVLPEPLVADSQTPFGQAALAILRAEHQRRLEALSAHGVPVIGWTGGVNTTATLRRLTLLRQRNRRTRGGSRRTPIRSPSRTGH